MMVGFSVDSSYTHKTLRFEPVSVLILALRDSVVRRCLLYDVHRGVRTDHLRILQLSGPSSVPFLCRLVSIIASLVKKLLPASILSH